MFCCLYVCVCVFFPKSHEKSPSNCLKKGSVLVLMIEVGLGKM